MLTKKLKQFFIFQQKQFCIYFPKLDALIFNLEINPKCLISDDCIKPESGIRKLELSCYEHQSLTILSMQHQALRVRTLNKSVDLFDKETYF